MIRPPTLIWAARIAWGIAGVAWFFWLAYEDQGLLAIQLVAMLIALASALTLLRRWLGTSQIPHMATLTRAGLVGLLCGAAVVLFAVILIAVKVALHAHPQPDFTSEDLQAVLARIPVWATAGLLAGLAAGLVLSFAYNEPQDP
jgi:hypothetical protein